MRLVSEHDDSAERNDDEATEEDDEVDCAASGLIGSAERNCCDCGVAVGVVDVAVLSSELQLCAEDCLQYCWPSTKEDTFWMGSSTSEPLDQLF